MTESRDSVTHVQYDITKLKQIVIFTIATVCCLFRMAKTAAERQQARRERLKLDTRKLAEYRKKDAERKKISKV